MSSRLTIKGHARDAGDTFTLLMSNGSTCYIRPETKHAAIEVPTYRFSKAALASVHGLVQRTDDILVVGGRLTFEVIADDDGVVYAQYKGQVS